MGVCVVLLIECVHVLMVMCLSGVMGSLQILGSLTAAIVGSFVKVLCCVYVCVLCVCVCMV